MADGPPDRGVPAATPGEPPPPGPHSPPPLLNRTPHGGRNLCEGHPRPGPDVIAPWVLALWRPWRNRPGRVLDHPVAGHAPPVGGPPAGEGTTHGHTPALDAAPQHRTTLAPRREDREVQSRDPALPRGGRGGGFPAGRGRNEQPGRERKSPPAPMMTGRRGRQPLMGEGAVCPQNPTFRPRVHMVEPRSTTVPPPVGLASPSMEW